MVSTASMALLKGSKPVGIEVAVPADAPPAPDTPAAGEETVVVDVDSLTGPQIAALVKEHGIEVPDNWKSMKLPDKKAWLNQHYGSGPATNGHDDGLPAATGPAAVEVKTGKTGKKGKAKPGKEIVQTVVGEVVGPDVIADIVHEIESLKEQDARALLHQLREQNEFNAFKIGGVLAVIHAHGWYQPYDSFKDYLLQEHGIRLRTAEYWIRIYTALAESGVAWDKVKGIGWTKLKEIAHILTPDNVDEWVEIAKAQTTLQLIETVAAATGHGPKQLTDQTSTVTTKTFKVHADQKEVIESALQKAKKMSKTEVDTVALEFICLDFLGTAKAADLPTLLGNSGLEATLEAFEQAFPEVELTVGVPE